MPPLRKPRQKSAAPKEEKQRFTLRLSVPMCSLLGLVLVAAVGWSFFMGFMVGRGQNPEQRVEQITGLHKDAPLAPFTAGPAADTAADTAADPAPDTAADSAADLAGNAGGQAMGNLPNAPGTAVAHGTAGRGEAGPAGLPDGQPAGQPDGQATASGKPSAYPFARPSGDSLTAWGSPGPGQTASKNAPQNQKTAASATPPAAAGPASPATRGQKPELAPEPLYDYVFQVAAFRGTDDANNLRQRLEGQGLRTRLQKSGKVHLVMVSLRGTELDADNLREELRRMKLGTPLQASKKAVPGKSRKTGR